MKSNEQEIERLLRQAPQPAPPAGLKDQLLARVPATGANGLPGSATRSSYSGNWLRRWWPVLAPAAVSLVCAVVLAVQQMEIRDLQDSIRALSKNSASMASRAPVTAAPGEDTTRLPSDLAAQEPEEIERLKQLAARIAADVSALEQMQKGNEVLRAQLNAPPTLSQDELDAVAKAKERAMSIHCVNNLKQFGLAVRIWMHENKEVSPPDILSMSNQINMPTVLVCRADTNRVAAKSWEVFTEANCSYEYLTPSVPNPDRDEPMRVQVRCPLHGHVGMSDGSVQSEVAKKHPERLKERDGKLYYEHQ